MASDLPGTRPSGGRPSSSLQPPGSAVHLPPALLAWDLFGTRRSAWNHGTDTAWDCFGFRIYNTWMEYLGVEVLVEQALPRGRRNPWLTAGKVTGLFNVRDPWLTVQTTPKISMVCSLGQELVVSVRAMKHWVSRWRRGLRGLRRQNASMVVSHKLPGVPVLVRHVRSFL